mgnify:CR=1 FL=1
MKLISRQHYLDKIERYLGKDTIIILTGQRRVGKSFVLRLFKDKVSTNPDNNIIYINKEKKEFDEIKNYQDLNAYIDERRDESRMNYVLVDEIQDIEEFEKSVRSYYEEPDIELIITGSNSKMLSKDIITAFRGRGDQIHIYPLSFKEYYEACGLPLEDAYLEYQYFGGMPLVLSKHSDEEKMSYLKELFSEIYIKDVVDRNGIKDEDAFTRLLSVLSSSIGSYTNPSNIENTFLSEMHVTYNHETIGHHINYIKDAFLVSEAKRYDIKGKKYIGANSKFYFTDIGLRNALINFRQSEPTHIMENIIYNELFYREFNVDVGVVEYNYKDEDKKSHRTQLEIDFVANKNSKRYYIQYGGARCAEAWC